MTTTVTEDTDIIAASPWFRERLTNPYRIVLRDLGGKYVIHTQYEVDGKRFFTQGHYFQGDQYDRARQKWVEYVSICINYNLEGIEYGYEKAGLVRWANQYLTGAGTEIQRRIESERKERADLKKFEHLAHGTALVLVTGESLAVQRRAAADQELKRLYPRTKNAARSRAEYDHTANERGREAGRRVGIHRAVE